MKQGDLVIRKSYGGDVIFKIEQMNAQQAILKGIEYRLLADAPVKDLQDFSGMRNQQYQHIVSRRLQELIQMLSKHRQDARDKQMKQWGIEQERAHPYFELPGKVLHVDGDENYLKKSLDLYKVMQIPAFGLFVKEDQMSRVLEQLLPEQKPDIVVITGHDGLLKERPDGIVSLNSYKNSRHFLEAVLVTRQYEKNKDTLVIIAGACQSHFEALIQAGANFASSPGRVLIHALDPVSIAAKAAQTSIMETMNITDVINHTFSGLDGVGGLESKGSYRIGLAKINKN